MVLPNNKGISPTIIIAITVNIVVFFIVVTTLTLVVAIAVCTKVRKTQKNEVSATRNNASGNISQDVPTHFEQDIYDYPNMSLQTEDSMDIQQNTAYATTIETKPSEAYAMNIITERNEAYEQSSFN